MRWFQRLTLTGCLREVQAAADLSRSNVLRARRPRRSTQPEPGRGGPTQRRRLQRRLDAATAAEEEGEEEAALGLPEETVAMAQHVARFVHVHGPDFEELVRTQSSGRGFASLINSCGTARRTQMGFRLSGRRTQFGACFDRARQSTPRCGMTQTDVRVVLGRCASETPAIQGGPACCAATGRLGWRWTGLRLNMLRWKGCTNASSMSSNHDSL